MESLRKNSGVADGKISYLVELETPEHAIPKIIQHEEIDLVITTAPVKRLRSDFYWRSDLDNIVFTVGVPVLTLYSALPLDDLRNIYLIPNNSIELKVGVVELIKVLREIFDARLHVLNSIEAWNSVLECSVIVLIAGSKKDLSDMLDNITGYNLTYKKRALWTFLAK